jgi:hypothetical protein
LPASGTLRVLGCFDIGIPCGVWIQVLTLDPILAHFVTQLNHSYGNIWVTDRMTDIFHFRWGFDPAGYQFIDKKLADKNETTLVTTSPTSSVFRRNSKEGLLKFYYSNEIAPDLHWKFAHLEETAEAAINFINEHGVLGRTGNINEEIGSAYQDQNADNFFSARKDVHDVMETLKSNASSGEKSAFMFNEKCASRMTILIDPKNPRRPTVKIIPTTLLSYIWLKVSEDITGGVVWKRCKYGPCNNYFSVGRGAGTKRREFCHEPNCKVYWHRQNNKEIANG